MAKFTTSRPLAMKYHGHDLTGPVGTVFRIPDSMRLSFIADFGNQMPNLTWIEPDEIGNGAGGAHPDLATHDALGLATDTALSDHDSDTNAHVYFALDVDLTTHTATGHPDLYSALIHTHAESSVTGLVSDLAGKAASIHSHVESSITGLVSDLAAKAALSHSHVDADIPAGIARDTEVSAAIDNHTATATHGGSGSIPAGIIAMWGGLLANIPSGWALCDGNNGTPDLRGLFVKGAAAGADPGATGGSATHTHADHSAHADHASHTHTYTQTVNHVHVQSVNSATTGGLSGYTPDTSSNTSVASGYSTQNPTGGVATGTTAGPSAALSHGAHSSHDAPNSEPPYYSLAYIQKL